MSHTDQAAHTGLIYLNGNLIDAEQARVSVFDFGFLYGYGLFETMRAYSGVIFRLEDHLLRLCAGAERLGFSGKISRDDLADACLQTLRANSLRDARLRLTVTPGNGDGMPDPGECSAPTVLVVARDYVSHPKEAYEKGFSAALSRWKRCAGSATNGTKNLSYAENLVGRFTSAREGFDESLFETGEGMLCEGSSSNVFVVHSGVLSTPRASYVLPGIARGEVLKIAASIGLGVEERDVHSTELFCASEAFLTNSMVEVMPLTTVGGKLIGDGRVGQVTRRLAKAYRDQVESAVASDSRQ